MNDNFVTLVQKFFSCSASADSVSRTGHVRRTYLASGRRPVLGAGDTVNFLLSCRTTNTGPATKRRAKKRGPDDGGSGVVTASKSW